MLDGHRRNNGNAESCSYHTKDAAELAALKNNVGLEAGAAAGGYRRFTEAVTVAQEQKRVVSQFPKRDRAAFCETVTPGQYGVKLFCGERKRLELVTLGVNGQRNEGNVRCAGAKALQKQGCNFLDDGNARFGILLGKAGQNRR